MRRYMRFLPIILAALALAASGSNIVLRNASAQLGGALGGKQDVNKQKGGGGATLSVAAQQQIKALLQEKQSRTPEQKKISSHLLYAMRAQRGEAMTSDGSVRRLNSAMSIAKSAMSASKTGDDGMAPVNIKAALSKPLLMTIEKLGGKIENISEKAGAIRALMPLSSLEALASERDVKSVRSADLDKMMHRQVTGSDVLNGRTTPLGMN